MSQEVSLQVQLCWVLPHNSLLTQVDPNPVKRDTGDEALGRNESYTVMEAETGVVGEAEESLSPWMLGCCPADDSILDDSPSGC